MRKLLTFLIALAAVVGVSAGSFGQGMTLPFMGGGCGGGGCGGGGGACAPNTIPGLVAWYKADVGAINSGTGVQATNGQTVDTWQDQSGNGYNATGHGFNSPTMNTTAINSKAGVVWTASAATALLTGPIAAGGTVVWGAGTTYSVYILGSLTNSAGGAGFGYTASGSISTDPNGGDLLSASTGPTFGFVHASGATYSGTATLNAVTRFGAIGDGTNFTPYNNNVAGTTAPLSFTFASPGTIYLGQQNGWDGPTREVIFFNQALSPTNQTCLDAYLVSRS